MAAKKLFFGHFKAKILLNFVPGNKASGYD